MVTVDTLLEEMVEEAIHPVETETEVEATHPGEVEGIPLEEAQMVGTHLAETEVEAIHPAEVEDILLEEEEETVGFLPAETETVAEDIHPVEVEDILQVVVEEEMVATHPVETDTMVEADSMDILLAVLEGAPLPIPIYLLGSEGTI